MNAAQIVATLPFQPYWLSNLALWLDPSWGVFTDTAATTPAGIGDSVAAWRCRATGVLFTQATGSARPLLQLNANGKLQVTFDGVNDSMTIASGSITASSWAGVVTPGGGGGLNGLVSDNGVQRVSLSTTSLLWRQSASSPLAITASSGVAYRIAGNQTGTSTSSLYFMGGIVGSVSQTLATGWTALGINSGSFYSGSILGFCAFNRGAGGMSAAEMARLNQYYAGVGL